MTSHIERISPWDIDSLVSAPALATLTGPRLKKSRADIMDQTHAPPFGMYTLGLKLDVWFG